MHIHSQLPSHSKCSRRECARRETDSLACIENLSLFRILSCHMAKVSSNKEEIFAELPDLIGDHYV